MAKSKLNPDNEKIKDKYYTYLKHMRSVKLVDDSITSIQGSIRKYEELFHYDDFKNFNADKGIEFYSSLKNEGIQLSTVFKHLHHLQEFLTWYFTNHKVVSSKKKLEYLSTLNPTEEDKRLNNHITYIEYPTLEEFEKIINFEAKDLIDTRDKAILAFLYISCARVSAVATSTIDSVDVNKMVYDQDPLEGVKTKRQKYIVTKLLPFDKKYYEIVKNWINLLKTQENFGNKDPLFPNIKVYANKTLVEKKPLGGEGEYNNLLDKRCKAAGIQKYNPHAFRHFGISQALKYVKTGTQLKALSQNVGHEDISTILEQYAKMKPNRYMQVLDDMINQGLDERPVSEISTKELMEILSKRIDIEPAF